MSVFSNKLFYPNGQPYLELYVHNRRIGIVEEVDGGFRAIGRRKPVETIQAAAKQLIDSDISKHHNEIQRLRSALDAVLRP